MTTILEICSHQIEFQYFSKSPNAVPSESEEQHVQDQLIKNYNQGELCMNKLINNRVYEFRGWWKILTPIN